LRDEAGPKTAIGKWDKDVGNSCTGKLAQHPLTETVEINPEFAPLCPGGECTRLTCVRSGGEKCCKHGCSGFCGRYTPLDIAQEIWSKMEWRISGCAHVHWAAYLTAHQRIYLHQQIVDDGQNGLTAVYSDTDSLFSSQMRKKNIGNNLGDFKLDGACGLYWDFDSLAPKTYCYVDCLPDGIYGPYRRIAKAKGMYKPSENWEAISSGQKIIQDRGVMSFKSALAKGGNLFQRKNITRVINTGKICEICGEIHIGDRLLKQLLTYPMHIDMVYAHERQSS
jgi:hypothetical protein